jgi:hypothetical protein
VGKTTLELAKSAIADIVIKDARIERFTVSTSVGFGIDLRASRTGFEAWLRAVSGIGLEPVMNRFHRLDESGEPVQYLYELFVEIPTGWAGS